MKNQHPFFFFTGCKTYPERGEERRGGEKGKEKKLGRAGRGIYESDVGMSSLPAVLNCLLLQEKEKFNCFCALVTFSGA